MELLVIIGIMFLVRVMVCGRPLLGAMEPAGARAVSSHAKITDVLKNFCSFTLSPRRLALTPPPGRGAIRR